MSYHNTSSSSTGAYTTTSQSTTNAQGQLAPTGYHYMPDGSLMSNVEHANLYGEKFISGINLNVNDILVSGETRTFTYSGQSGATCSLEVYYFTGTNTLPYYYNFGTKEWVQVKDLGTKKNNISPLEQVEVIFEKMGSHAIRTYTFNVIAEGGTKHVDYVESRNINNKIVINDSLGSNSNLLQKIIYQDVEKTINLSCIAPSLTNNFTDNTVSDLSGGASNRILTTVAEASSLINVGDKITGTGAADADHVLVTKINPDGDDPNEIEINQLSSAGSGVTMTYTPVFNGIRPNGTVSTVGRAVLKASSGNSSEIPFEITILGPSTRTMEVLTTPTVDHLCVYVSRTFGAEPNFAGDEDITDNTHFLWPMVNIAGLQGGMVLDPEKSNAGGAEGANTSNGLNRAVIAPYETSEVTHVITDDLYEKNSVAKVLIKAVDEQANPITGIDRNGFVTAQAGNICFSKQQAAALGGDSPRIFGHGQEQIRSLTRGMSVGLSDVKIVATEITTTTTADVHNSVTIPVAETGNISSAQTMSGVGTTPSVADPTVLIKSTKSGAGNLTVSSAQTLENGQTLSFSNGTNSLKLTGTLRVFNMGITDVDLYFDLEKFIAIT